MIIDAHVHVGVSTAYNFSANVDDLLRLADENGIDKLFVTDFTALVHDMREGNDALGKAVRQHPDRILGYVSIPTMNFDNGALEEIDRCVLEYGMRGIKIYSYPKIPLVRPSVFPVLERAASHRMPILAHSTAEECEVMASPCAGGAAHDGALRQHGSGAGRLDACGAGCGAQSFTHAGNRKQCGQQRLVRVHNRTHRFGTHYLRYRHAAARSKRADGACERGRHWPGRERLDIRRQYGANVGAKSVAARGDE